MGIKEAFQGKNLKWWLLGGAAVVGGYILLKRGSGAPGIPGAKGTPGVPGGMPGAAPLPGTPDVAPGSVGYGPAAVHKGERVSAMHFDYIAAKTAGMKYAKAALSPKEGVVFTSPSDGLFTRNVLKVGKNIWAEVQPSTYKAPIAVAGYW